MKRERILKMSDFETLKKTAINRISEDWVLCFDPPELERAKRVLAPLTRIFYKELEECPLLLFYVYKQEEQTSPQNKYDGNLYREVDDNGELIYCVLGISTEALQMDNNYLAMVFMHETAHIKYPEHNIVFHKHLNSLINTYNLITGSTVINDYYGLTEKEKQEFLEV